MLKRKENVSKHPWVLDWGSESESWVAEDASSCVDPESRSEQDWIAGSAETGATSGSSFPGLCRPHLEFSVAKGENEGAVMV